MFSQMLMGPHPVVVITDIDLGRKVMMRYHKRPLFEFMTFRQGLDDKVFNSSLVFINGEKVRPVASCWKLLQDDAHYQTLRSVAACL